MKTNLKKALSISMVSVSILALISWMGPKNIYQAAIENDFIKSLKTKLTEYNKAMPEDRVYLQFDKPFYEPGETIWFSAYVRNAETMKASEQSGIVHVDLINPKGGIEKTIKMLTINGKAAGDFSLDAEAVGGMYKVKAYTNWQKNDGENAGFEKEVQVQDIILPNLKMKLDFERKAFGAGDEVVAKLKLNTNENKPLSDYNFRFVANLGGAKLIEKATNTDEEGVAYIRFKLPKEVKTTDGLVNVMIDYNGSTESVSRSIPIVLNKIKFQLFPEGGDMVNGLESKIAFRALNEFDKPADVEGVILTAKGSVVESFISYHQGMGTFALKPQNGEKYYAKITKPEGIKDTFELPEALPAGYVLGVDNSRDNELTLNIGTTQSEELSIVTQVRGKIYYATAFNAVAGFNKLVIPTKDFPIGVTQVTLFDQKGIDRAERLAFVNKDKQLNISIATDKEKYLPREKVKMTITVKDEKGIPMPGNFSLSVTNDQLLAFADDKSGNMLSQLLLQQDIKEKVEEPALYFDEKEYKADKALDYLLMTSGWRRFTWEKVNSGNIPYTSFQPERAIISGTVYDAYTGKVIKNATLKPSNSTTAVLSNANGKFVLKNIDLSQPNALVISAEGYTNQTQYLYNYGEMACYLYNPNYYNNQKHRSPRPSAANRGAAAGNKRARMADIEDAPMPMEENFVGRAMEGAMEMNAPEAVKKMERNEAPKMLQAPKVKKDDAKKGEENNLKKVASKAAKDEDAKAGLNMGDVMVDDNRANGFGKAELARKAKQAPNQNQYYRARQFAAPVYDKDETVATRTDFRSTIYWNPSVDVDRSGKKTIEFYNSDDISSFRASVEGIASDGMIGRSEKTFFTQLPFAMSTKVPVEVATGDIVSIPLTLKNNTDKPLGGAFTVVAPEELVLLNKIEAAQTIMPGKAKVVYLDYKVSNKLGEGIFKISFKSCGLGDSFTQKIKIVSKGFPVHASFSAQEKEKDYSVNMQNVVDGSIRISFTAFPNVVGDLMKGVEGILREPSGCFEQTSMSSYPNAMVLDYMQTTDNKDEKVMANAQGLLNRGYKRLCTFETKDRGYEWFGSNPGHEALTAYGLMQFADMKKVGEKVDQGMMDRTAKWLLDRKDNKGGFDQNSRALDNFGRASKEIADAYIVYALAEAGYTKDIKDEFANSYKKAMETKDPYMLALVANISYKMGDTKKGDDALSALYSKQADNGSWTGSKHSITYSTGQSLTIETTSLGIMAMLKSPSHNSGSLTKAIQYLVGARSGSGAFGNTQGTVLALKALTEYAKASKKTNEDGTIELYVDGKKVAEKSYKAGEKEAIEINELEKFASAGKHDFKVKYVGVKEPLPYSLSVNWNTYLPKSSEECVVALNTKLAAKSVLVGETVRMTANVKNTKNEGIPSTMVIIGIPAGLTAQPWQLKELQEKKVFDYYEIIGNNIAIYYRCMSPAQEKTINLDLKAEVPGEYDAPASSGYLYYTNEFKSWCGVERITVKKPMI